MSYSKKIISLLNINIYQFVGLSLLFLASSFLEIIGIGLIGAFFSVLVDNNSTFIDRMFSMSFINSILPFNDKILSLSFLLVVIFFISGSFRIIVTWLILRFSAMIQVKTQKKLLSNYLNYSFKDFLDENSSEHVQTILKRVAIFGYGVVQSFFKIIADSISFIFIISFLAYLNIYALSILILCGLIIFLIYKFLFSNRLIKYGELANLAENKIVQNVQEGILGFKELRVLNKSNFFVNNLEINALVHANNSVKMNTISTAPRSLVEFFMILFMFLLLSFLTGKDSVDFDGFSYLPIFASFGTASLRIMPMLNNFLYCYSQLKNGKHSIDTIYHSLFEKTTPAIHLEGSSIEIFQSINFQDVSYSYEKNKKIIEDVNLTINKGDFVNLAGASGSGKTTFISLLMGLLFPKDGKIKVNGTELNESNSMYWQKNIFYLPQDTFILDSSLETNISLLDTLTKNDSKKIEDSLAKSNLIDKEASLRLGEGGKTISGGQRQRVALARMFYFDRDFLVIDEATSALDKNTEKKILNELLALKGKKTIIGISHSNLFEEIADKTYNINDGKLNLINRENYEN